MLQYDLIYHKGPGMLKAMRTSMEAAIAAGWQPLGGPTISEDEGECRIVQAITKGNKQNEI